MEFASAEDLQEFLSQWLEDHGHAVYRNVPYNNDKNVDILTQAYTIDCQHTLSPDALWIAAAELQACHPHFPEQKPVIAGLSPEVAEETYLAAEQIKSSGIEIWFIDQMPPFVEYYTHLKADPLFQEEKGLTTPLGERRSPLAGCFISLGMAAILTISFWVAYRILDRHQVELATGTREGQAWEALHAAVSVWDLDTARSSLKTLENSRSSCIATFAERFDHSLEELGADGFRDINPIKRALNQQQGCNLEMRDYEFSP